MATKAEYLTSLDAKCMRRYPEVEDITVRDNTGGQTALYNVPMMVKLPNGTVQVQTQGFYVNDEGTQDESAFPVNQERKDDPPPTFEPELRAFIEGQITRTLPTIIIETVNNDSESAEVTAYEFDTNADDFVKTRRFITKDASGNLFMKKLRA